MVEKLLLSSCLTDEWTKSLKGKFVGENYVDHLLGERDVDVYKPDGSLLLAFRRRALPSVVCRAAYPVLLRMPKDGSNRGVAAGGRAPRRRRDGTWSRNTYATAKSAVVGFLDRNPRMPYCRATAFTWKQVQRWRTVLPFIGEVDRVFSEAVPARYAAQRAVADETSADFVIAGTAFTTVTVNQNWRTAVHKDQGDLPTGFGAMSVLRAGEYAGGYLVFPKYGVAVDMRSQDVLLSDVHEWHGNTPIIGTEGEYERISAVMYFRTKMRRCGTALQEHRALEQSLCD